MLVSTHGPQVHEQDNDDLLDGHDDQQVDLQLLLVLQVHNADEVARVIVEELKHVGLVDQRVFQVLLKLVPLIQCAVVAHVLVDRVEDRDEEHVDDGG